MKQWTSMRDERADIPPKRSIENVSPDSVVRTLICENASLTVSNIPPTKPDKTLTTPDVFSISVPKLFRMTPPTPDAKPVIKGKATDAHNAPPDTNE